MAASVLGRRHRNALQVLGYLYIRMGRHGQAKRLFTALVRLDPGDMLAHRCLVAACVGLGEGEEALACLEKAMGAGRELPPEEAALHLVRARALWLCARGAEAREAVRTYVALSGRDA